MRKVMEQQMVLGEIPISEIEFDLNSRDEIPKLLIGLQNLYNNNEARTQVFKILEKTIPNDIDNCKGRPGMDLWKILVLGTIRLSCNCDYDKLQELANNHAKIRQMLGHGRKHSVDDGTYYALQTLKDNLSLLTEEKLKEINKVVVKLGHKELKMENEDLKGRCDSFVLETNVHYPTDINLLFDAIRKIIQLISALCSNIQITDWIQWAYYIRKIKKEYNKIIRLKKSTSKNEEKKAAKEKQIIDAHKKYIDLVRTYVDRAKQTIIKIKTIGLDAISEVAILEIEKYLEHAVRQIDHIERRVIKGEKIPHNEKVFSIFEEHTEWISKGKAGVSQELGLRVCILEDQCGFILNHKVMQKKTDEKVTLPMVFETKKIFPNLNSCSFDKGFYSKGNKEELEKSEEIDMVILPKKGKLSQKDKEEIDNPEYKEGRRKHSGVESAINALENHGLDRCPDKGIERFKKYVGLAVLARNIQIFGNIIQQKELKRQKRRLKIKKTWEEKKLLKAA